MTDSSHGQPLHHHQDPSLTASNPHRWTPKHSPVPSKEPEDSDDQDPFQPIDSSPKQDLHPVSFIDATSDSYMSPTAVARSSPSSSPMPDSHPIQKRDSVDSQDSFRRDAAPTWKTMADYDSFASENDRDHSEEDTDSDDDQDDDSSSDLSTDSEDNNRRSINQGYLEGTQRLLASSSNVRRGGLGMGIRAGETGTGTMIGLDLGQSLSQRVYEDDDDRYEEGFHDTLPLTAMDAHQLDARLGQKKEEEKAMQQGTALGGSIRSKNKKGHGKRHGSSKRSKKSQRGEGGVEDDSRPGLEAGLGMSSEQAARLAKRQFRVQMVWNAFYVFAWYLCSTSLSFYNKWLFSPQLHNFRFPLFTTCLHMVAQFTMAVLTLALMPALRPKKAPSAKDFGTKIMPCAIASGLDIGLSNNSLKTITLAFYTMCKSSSLAFVLLFAFIFRLEKPSWKYVGIIGVICMGLFMMVMSEVDFVLIGFIQVMLASVLGGLRWSLTQLLLERSDAKSGSLANPISTILFLSPIMGVCLAIVAGIFEGYGTIFESTFFATLESTMTTLGLLLFGGVIAFAMVLAEFNLIARTSVVTLSVLGIVKEIVTIVISSFVFHDKLTIVNTLGLFVTLSGIGLYHYMKMTEMKAKTQKAAEELSLHGIASRSSDESESSALNPLSPPMDERRLKKKKRREGEKSPKKEVEEQSGGGRPAVMVDEVSWDEAPLLQSGGQQDRQDLKKQRDLSDTEPFVLEEPPTHSKQ